VYPDDLDTTSLALATLHYDADLAHSILDEMLHYVDEDGFVQVCTCLSLNPHPPKVLYPDTQTRPTPTNPARASTP
jgi:hypothetical protein